MSSNKFRKSLAAAAALFAICAATPALLATAQQTSAEPDTLIYAGKLLADPASGRVLTQQTITVRSGRIVSVAAGYTKAPNGAKVVDLKNAFVLPGLIDSHVHITGEQGPTSRLDGLLATSADDAISGAGFGMKTLMAGFTTVADLGAETNAIMALRKGIARGTIPGPRIIAAGPAVSVHGGHGDANGIPPALVPLYRGPGVCSGPDDCARATRELVRDGADIVKITATGGVLSDTAAGLGQQFTDAELAAIVQAAHSMGRKVTAHAHGADGINSFLKAGGDSIEHGTYANAESAALFKSKGAYLIPTLLAGDFVAREAAKPDTFLTPNQKKKALQAGPLMLNMLREMHAAGVKIAFGTDTGVSAHGDNAQEFALMVKAGMTPLETIQAATVNAADHFSLSAEIGTITAGKAADIIAVNGDPLSNVRELESVDFVMRAGKVFKN